MFDYLQNYLSTVHISALLILLGIVLGTLLVIYAVTVIAGGKFLKKQVNKDGNLLFRSITVI